MKTIPDWIVSSSGVEAFTDYYPFGFAMPGRQYITGSPYRFGYQGQFAEKDEETGLNHFEARAYDSRIGRWLTTDPANQFWSPYLGMGNNWPGGVDPDGEWVKGAGFFRNIFMSDTQIAQRATEKANSGPLTILFVDFLGDGASDFLAVEGGLGKVLANNPSFFRKLMDKYGSSPIGKNLFMNYLAYNTAQMRDGAMALIGLFTLPLNAVDLGAGIGAMLNARNSSSIISVSKISTGNYTRIDGFKSLYSKSIGPIRSPSPDGIFIKGKYYPPGQYTPRSKLHFRRGENIYYNDLPALSTGGSPTPMNINAHWGLRVSMATGGSGLVIYKGLD